MAKVAINIATGSIQQQEVIVGIDLGTTNSIVAIIHPDTKLPIALKDTDQTVLVPSIIHFSEQDVIVGNAAKQYLENDIDNTIYSIKRLMGKSYKDIHTLGNKLGYTIIDDDTEKLVKIKIGNAFYSPIELSSYILIELKKRAEHVLKTPVHKCVITVPAYFNDAQRQATRDAGKLAGLDVLRIINEPTAASLAYGFGAKHTSTKNVVVYDLGGGTFDVSVLQITPDANGGIFEVLSTNGNTYLGGDDFDQEIVSHFLAQLTCTDTKKTNKQFLQQLRLKAEEAKKYLSNNEQYSSVIEELAITITKTDFEEKIKHLADKTIQCCNTALHESRLTKEDIDEIVMVGGSTRIPFIKQQVQHFFNKKINDSVNPDEVVALGAAIQADILAGNNKDFLLLDITPLSLGIETMGGLMDVLLPRNSKIPSSVARQYTTQKDGQGSMRISVFQGERDLVKDNRKLAEFYLTNIPDMPAGLPKVEVKFIMDADGILKVQAMELRSGVIQSIEVKPQYGLTDTEVETMLMSSITNAKTDIATRALVETTTEAEHLIDQTLHFIAKHNSHITEQEKLETDKTIALVQEKIIEKNKDAIASAVEQLNKVTSPFAERVMDIAIAEAMKGKQII